MFLNFNTHEVSLVIFLVFISRDHIVLRNRTLDNLLKYVPL